MDGTAGFGPEIRVRRSHLTLTSSLFPGITPLLADGSLPTCRPEARINRTLLASPSISLFPLHRSTPCERMETCGLYCFWCLR